MPSFGKMVEGARGVVLLVVAVASATIGAVFYFAPRGETFERIKHVEFIAGMTQSEFAIFQVDSQIRENRRQLRQIAIDEQSAECTPAMKRVFEKQKEDIKAEIELLTDKRRRLEKQYGGK
jgi:hypothetical protein